MYVDEKQRITKTERKRKNVLTNVRFFLHSSEEFNGCECVYERESKSEREKSKKANSKCVCVSMH